MGRQSFWQDTLHATPNVHRVAGRFTTADDAAPTAQRGKGFNAVGAPTTGVYVVTCKQTFGDYIGAGAQLDGAAGNAQDVKVTAVSPTAAGGATITLETQSADGTAADLDGPIVSFWVEFTKGQDPS